MQKINFHNGTAPALNATNLNLMQDYIEEAIEQGGGGGGGTPYGDTLPIGAILPFGGGTVPDNYLLCDGQAVSRTDYSQLFATIGTYWGVGDGSTTFNIPNLKGRTFFGYDASQTEFDTIGEIGGSKSHTNTLDDNGYAKIIFKGVGEVSYLERNVSQWDSNYSIDTNGSGQTKTASENYGAELGGQTASASHINPYGTGLWIIKAFQSAGVVAEVVNQYSTSQTNTYSADYVNNLNAYSTTEKRIGTWIDGKPLYEKVIDFGACPDNSSKNVAHNISNLKRIIRLFGFAGSSTSKGGITLPHGSSSPIALYADDTNVTVNAFQNASQYTQTYIWIQYTKTTD